MAPAVRGARTGYAMMLQRDETGDSIGSSSVRLSHADTLTVGTTLFGTPTISAGEGSFDITLIKREAGQHRQEDYGVCGRGRAVKVLIYKSGEWKCSACHKLVKSTWRVVRVGEATWIKTLARRPHLDEADQRSGLTRAQRDQVVRLFLTLYLVLFDKD